MCSDKGAGQTHMFVLRLWLEPMSEGRAEIRVEVRHLPSGRRRRMKDWSMLAAFIDECISEQGPISSGQHPEKTQDADTTH